MPSEQLTNNEIIGSTEKWEAGWLAKSHLPNK
jgi:hypothetical protein